MKELHKKICMCGDPSVGKTSLVRKFVTGKYDEDYVSTLGTVVKKKSVYSKETDTMVNLMIWDISGQSKFKRIHASAFADSTGTLAVCDLTRPETAQHLQDWLTSVTDFAKREVPVMILTNKSDLEGQNEDDAILAEDAAKAFGHPIFKTSAKTGVNVDEAFTALADAIARETDSYGAAVALADVAVSEMFSTPSELLDYMAILFSKVLGDQEMGMHIVRKQVTDEGFDFRWATKENVRALVDRLIKIIREHKGEKVAMQFREELLRALEQCEG
jgi:small GTP-binding protein